MTRVPAFLQRLAPLVERVNGLSLRERVLVFGAGVALVIVAWQVLLMDPLSARLKSAEQRLSETSGRTELLAAGGMQGDPRLAGLARQRALRERLAALDAQLQGASGGYVPPQKMVELLQQLLASQRALKLVRLRNLPVESLLPAVGNAAAPGPATLAASGVAPDPAATPAASGPFIHPVEVVVEGDYLAIVAYLRVLEKLPWRVQWRRLDLEVGEYPQNRVRIEIGTVSLAREWLIV